MNSIPLASSPALWVVPQQTSNTDLRVLWLLILPGCVLAALLYSAGQTQAAVAMVGLAFALGVFISPEVGLYAYMVLQALDSAFITSTDAVLTPAKILAPFLLVVYVLRMDKPKTEIALSRPVLLAMLFFGLYGIMSAGIAPAPLAAARYGGQVVVQVLLVGVFLHLLGNRVLIGRAMFFCVAGGAAGATFMLVTGGVSRHFGRGTLGEFANPNTTALALSVSLIAIPAAWALTRRKWLHLAYLMAAPIILIAIMKTGSRSALVAVVLSFAAGAVIAKKAKWVYRIIVAGAATFIVLATLSYALGSGLLTEKSKDRLETFIEDRGSAGQDARIWIWREALETYMRRPQGFGYGNTAFALAERTGHFKDIHSSYLGVLVEGGPIALLLFGFGLWHLVRCVRGIRQGSLGIPAAMVLCFLGLSCLTHTIHFTKWFWVPVTICLLLAEQAAREQMPKRATQPFGNEDPSGMLVAATRSPHSSPGPPKEGCV